MSIPKSFEDAVMADWTHDDKTNIDTLYVRFVVSSKTRVSSVENVGRVKELVKQGVIENMRCDILKLVQDEPIVKCRCCRYFNVQPFNARPKLSNDYSTFWCAKWRGYGANPDGFCAWGEKL